LKQRHAPPSAQERHAPPAAAQRQPRFKKPPLTPQVTTLWDYPSQHYGEEEQGSQAYRGATPSYVIWNVLHRFTREGDTVIDPFVGSGTTLDVCRDLGRKGLGFDLVATREDVTQADARSLPLKQKSAELVFMDPPYADNLDYSDDPRCIGKLPADGRWERAMRLVVTEAARVLKDDGVLAMYVCDVFQKKRGFFALGFELYRIAKEQGLVPIDVVSVVRHNRTLDLGNYRKAADEAGFFLRGFNYLILFRKPAKDDARTPTREAAPRAVPGEQRPERVRPPAPVHGEAPRERRSRKNDRRR
jgi:DNA modification methylase